MGLCACGGRRQYRLGGHKKARPRIRDKEKTETESLPDGMNVTPSDP